MAGKFEAAFEADRSADPLSWTWTDLTALTETNEVTVSRGRSSSRTQVADPASASFPLRNGGGAVTVGSLTPRKGTGDWYPGVRRGLPLRYSVHAGQSYLAVTGVAGSNATTPDAASWAISPDIAVAVQFRGPIRLPPALISYEVFGQFTVTGGERAWLFFLGNDGSARLRVSSDGTAESDSRTDLAIPSPDAGPLTVALAFDGDNGAVGNTTTWHVLRGTIDDLLADPAAFTFGDPHTNFGTLTLHNSTGTVGVGDVPGSGFAPYPGCIDRVYVRAGTLTSGTVVADADFTAETAETTSFADDADTPKTWTISNAEITDRKIRLLGEYGSNKGTYPGAGVAGTAQRTISVAGPLRRMRQGDKPLRSALYRRITAPATDTTVHAYWPLEDGRDATSLFTIGGSPGGIMAVSSLGADDTLAASEPLPSVSGGQPYGWNLSLPPVADTQTWEYTMLVNIPVAPDAGAGEFLDLCRIDCKGGVTSQWVLRIDDAFWRVFAKDLDGINILSASGSSNDDRLFDDWLIVTLTIDVVGLNITWDLDLIPLEVGAAFGGSGTIPSFGLPAGRPVRLRNLSSSAPQEGFSCGHFIVTQGAAAGWLAPADTAYVGEPAPARVFRLCRELDIPVAVDGPHMVGVSSGGWARSIAAGAQPMGPQRPLPLLDLLEECAVVDRGYLGETRELLGISYRSGATLIEQSPRLSSSTEVTADDFGSADDDSHYVNRVEVERPLGSKATHTATGDDDPDTAGLYESSRTVNVETDGDLLGHAAWWVHESTWPEERHDTIPIDIPTSSVDTWHDMSVGDVVAATSLPAAAAESSVTQLVDGWTETVSPFLISARPNTRPAGPWDVGFVDDDPPDTDAARIDSTGTTLTGSLDDSTTGAVSVDVTGTLWTTAAGYQPLVIRVDSEDIALSAISGASSPQTFTVATRGANGTEAAAHDAGAEIHPARPLRVAPSKRSP